MTTSDGLAFLETSYPDSKPLVTDFSEESIAVYEGTARITATVNIPQGQPIENALVLRVQACDLTRCLLPSEISLKPAWTLEQ
jgi:hypothetical protein